jgi:hypothetical protein
MDGFNMTTDKPMLILIGILALYVFIPKIVTLNVITYAFIVYMIIVFLQGLRKKEE